MQAPVPGISDCTIDFLCAPGAPPWSGWAFLAWLVLMVGAGTFGIVSAFWSRRRSAAARGPTACPADRAAQGSDSAAAGRVGRRG